MPPDQADWFLAEIVLPTAQDFLKKPADVRLGMLAAVVVSSLADYIYEERPAARGGAKSVGKFRERLAQESEAFALARDVGDATKHVRLTRDSADFKDVRDMERKSSLLRGADGRQLLGADGARLMSAETVVAIMADGREEVLAEAIRGALDFCREQMLRHPS